MEGGGGGRGEKDKRRWGEKGGGKVWEKLDVPREAETSDSKYRRPSWTPEGCTWKR